MPLPASHLCYKVVTIASAARTAGTRYAILHGLKFRPHINACIPVCQGANDGTNDAVGISVVNTTSTQIVIKVSDTKTCSGIIIVLLDTDVGGVNPLTSAGSAAV